MKLYLSSYQLGDDKQELRKLIAETSGVFGYIPNSLDGDNADQARALKRTEFDVADLESLGAQVEILDLKHYFSKKEKLEGKLSQLGGVYVRGGNTFVLRQAMKLSGFDSLLLDEVKSRQDFLYIGYSAGVCVLTPDLKPYAITDDATDFPYADSKEQIWDGLGIVPFVFEPHYKSDHDESESTDKEIQYCIENKLLFKAYRDGESFVMTA